MSPDSPKVVIIGGGHAGGSAAVLLREFGWPDAITLVCEENALPYQRPPLSKKWLKGEAEEAGLRLKPEKFYSDNRIDIRSKCRAVAIDRQQKTVSLDTGDTLSYSHLIVATGASPVMFPGSANLNNVMALRTIADADRVRGALRPGATLAIAGGGFVGLEVAATARELGMNVVVVEREQQLMARTASPALATAIGSNLRAKAFRLELGRTIDRLVAANGTLSAIALSCGTTLPVDALLVGIGARPNDAMLSAAGVICEGGVLVDECARSSDENIFAIGDCTNRPIPYRGARGRLESVPSALEQARQAASAICGRPAPQPEVPWFWSDQGNVKIQIAGLRHGETNTVLRGDPAAMKFALFHLNEDDTVRCVEAVNSPAEFMAGKSLISRAKAILPEKLADRTIAMRELVG